jgi:hypothetical protein
MRSFPFFRLTASHSTTRPGATPSGADGAFQDTVSDLRGWFDSSSDLKCGLQVQEDDFDSLPAEVKATFKPR